MQKQIKSALISVFYKDNLEAIVKKLGEQGVTIYSTGGTQKFIEEQGVKCVAVEDLTAYPSILGGRVKTLHPKVFGGILARREQGQDLDQLQQYEIPEIDLVIVDLYPFEETVKTTSEEQAIIEKIDIGGVSLIRAAGKNHKDVVIVASKDQYADLEQVLISNNGATTLEERRAFAAKAFEVCAHYDVAIAQWFLRDGGSANFQVSKPQGQVMRYGENPHQRGVFYGDLSEIFEQLHGKELSYNNLVDVDAACQLIAEFKETTFAVIKHTNVCGIASRGTLKVAWEEALAGDKESAFGGVLVCNAQVDKETAASISEIFFEILIAPGFDEEALTILKGKKNRILLQQRKAVQPAQQFKNVLNGVLVQDGDNDNYKDWTEAGARSASEAEKADLEFANLVCKHLKSNAIALVKDRQLVGKGCGQTSRIDALRHAIEKAKQFNFDLKGAVMASDAFFPFDDCVRIADEAGISAVIQPGGSVRDNDSISYCKEHNMVMVMTGMRHFRH
ncbi:bifunctional phosphoribosylaminoimidazolecarboxamide formyltransferase/IMP cyclohydrolase [Chitinophaga pendula]|uniref:bifunctional phosphoribosylaminoimidazolecarboxamide formyltransferase/IMP cyclohydrolase n=1 Tax=Chitinophaga TaxID=79328 RepID=UPI000BAFA74A|nr:MULTISPECIES: bifunctional phosphoribosylaminoimidazolecarboxamide formyltransferase/IMP cyclohydrolase [Chitinophaga]ASZ10550.1 bifunctional phosphoribosylaminoimidazolecarboxamide formyltransferase/IMP cyclohydrolase PurH [Chitinophaga sp. MD30]UCJ06476.1 bifunctional phosphoribosylaminoimidazolecarboxamide formyltransferase/IMP cyclohydrolase [Chitinophaga pendula]